jgi:hypothetical protein
MNPFIFTELGVEGSFLQPFQFEREPRSQFLKPRSDGLFFLPINISMMSYKYEIALIMKRDHLSALQLWIMGVQRSKEAANTSADSGAKVVQY